MFLLVQNDPQCPPGTCTQLIDAAGQPYRILAAFAEETFPDPRQLTGVIVLGGDMGVHETGRFPYLKRVRQFMKTALETGTPLLGICLGGQLLSLVAGGSVASPSPHGEKGINRVALNAAGAADPLFSGVPSPFVTFQLHNDSFAVPPDAALLASSEACPAQAFRLGKAVYGVQFHPEVNRAIVECWDNLSEPPLDLTRGFLASQPAFDAASHTIISNFISLAAACRLP